MRSLASSKLKMKLEGEASVLGEAMMGETGLRQSELLNRQARRSQMNIAAVLVRLIVIIFNYFISYCIM